MIKELFEFEQKDCGSIEWELGNLTPFDECLFSWNALCKKGFFSFYMRLFVSGKWTPWFLYATWGNWVRRTYSTVLEDVVVDCDRILVKQGAATGFHLSVRCHQGAEKTDLHKVACVFSIGKRNPTHRLKSPMRIANYPYQSQLETGLEEKNRICSPTSLFSVLSYFFPEYPGSIKDFVPLVRDQYHDIYGNWPLNVAGFYEASEGQIFARVEKLAGLEEVHTYLEKNIPVVVSVKGEIEGANQPYSSGHLLVITGLSESAVECMDPAVCTGDRPHVTYPKESFINAWENRNFVAYTFQPRK